MLAEGHEWTNGGVVGARINMKRVINVLLAFLVGLRWSEVKYQSIISHANELNVGADDGIGTGDHIPIEDQKEMGGNVLRIWATVKDFSKMHVGRERHRILPFIAAQSQILSLLCSNPCGPLLVDGHHLPQVFYSLIYIP